MSVVERDLDDLARSLRRERVCPLEAPRLELGLAEVERMLPHRGAMRLVDAVEAFDPPSRSLRARSWLGADAMGFDGHFPNHPVFPGVLQVEMVGQAGLCLGWLLDESREGPVEARVLKVHHATFLAPIEPETLVTIEAHALEHDGLTGRLAGQLWRDEVLCSTAIVEVYFV